MILIYAWCQYRRFRMVFHRFWNRKTTMDYFYRSNPDAQAEKVYKLFYDLYKEGLGNGNASSDRYQEWDVKCMNLLMEYCTHDAIRTYLASTGRTTDFVVVQGDDHCFGKALAWVKDRLDDDFWNKRFIKTPAH